MAAIDKTYVKSWEEWNSIMEWVRSHDTEVDSDHTKLSEYLPVYYELDDDCILVDDSERDFTKEEVEEMLQHTSEVAFWNTDWNVDYWLIHNCDLPIIVNRLHEQYGDDEFERIKSLSETDWRKELDTIEAHWREELDVSDTHYYVIKNERCISDYDNYENAKMKNNYE